MTFDVAAADVWRRPPGIAAPGPGAGRVFVTNNLEDTVSIVDLDALLAGTPASLGKVPVGFVPVEREGPHHVTADSRGEHYFIGISNFVPGGGSGPHGVHGNGSASGHLLKVRVDDNTQVQSVRVDRNPGDVRLTPDGALLLATHFDMLRVTEAAARGVFEGPELDSTLAVVDPARMELLALVPACPAAHGISITPDSALAVMSCRSDEVAIVDLRGAGEVGMPDVTRVPVVPAPGTALAPSCEPYAMTADGETAWVSCYASGLLVAVDVRGAALDGRTFQLPGRAVFGDVHGGVLAVAHQQVDGVTFLRTADASLASTRLLSPDVCVAPHATRFIEDGTRLLVVCEGTRAAPGHLLLLDASAPHEVLARVELGLFPDDMAVVRRAP